MELDATHRETTAIRSESDYGRFADECTAKLKSIAAVDSITIAGSVAKGDVVPWWSDLDILIFYSSAADPLLVLDNIRAALNPLHQQFAIGLGCDLVATDDFEVTRRLGGRPLAMTFELAQYAKTTYGPNFLQGLRPNSHDLELIRLERALGIAVEIHNWRRRVVASDEALPIEKLKRDVKSMLRILKYESNPEFVAPYTYQAALHTVERHGVDFHTLRAYRTAVQIRRDWLFWLSCSDVEPPCTLLQEVLAKYPLRT